MESIFEKSLIHTKYSINDSWHCYTYNQDAHTKESPDPDGELLLLRLHLALVDSPVGRLPFQLCSLQACTLSLHSSVLLLEK